MLVYGSNVTKSALHSASTASAAEPAEQNVRVFTLPALLQFVDKWRASKLNSSQY